MEVKILELKDLLGRFNKILLSGEVQVEAVRDVLYEVLKVKIKKEDIKIKNNIIYLNIQPIYKNEIFLNKEKIISMLEEALGQKAPKNIR